MENITIHCQLVAKEVDLMNYQTLVFKTLESNVPFGHHYSLITVFPNWQSRIPEIGEIGYLNYDEVVGGQDTYYDRNLDSIVKYNFSNLIFNKFIREVDSFNQNIII